MKKICLDYGHGGYDPGASYKGRKESDDNILVGKILADILRKSGVEVVETRSKDTYVSLEERVRIANKEGVDWFISIHRNAFMPEKAKGVEVYTYKNPTAKARTLGGRIEKSLVKLGFKSRGVKLGDFYVLRKTKAPAILIELGFLDNSQDNELFDRKLCQIARNISQEILAIG